MNFEGGERFFANFCESLFESFFSDPDALRGSFGFYRAWDITIAQNEQRKSRPLSMPVLAIGGAESWGELRS
jgi:hypothetical protein